MRKTLVVLLVILKMDIFVSSQQDYYDNYQVRFQTRMNILYMDSTLHVTTFSQNVLIAVDCLLEPALTAVLSVAVEKSQEGQHR